MKAFLALVTAAVAGLLAMPASGKGMLVLQCGSDWCAKWTASERARTISVSPRYLSTASGSTDFNALVVGCDFLK